MRFHTMFRGGPRFSQIGWFLLAHFAIALHPFSLTSLIPFFPFSILLPLENDRNACSEFGGDEKNAIAP